MLSKRGRRGFSPSCSTRRMEAGEAHLVDRVLSRVPLRQFVLTLPIGLLLCGTARPDRAWAGGGVPPARASSCRPGGVARHHLPDRGGNDHLALLVGGEPEHPLSLPGAGRCIPGRGRRAAAFRGGGGADPSTGACAAGGDDRAADAAVRAPRRRSRRTGSRLARRWEAPGGRRGRGCGGWTVGLANSPPRLDDLSHRHRPACRPPHRDDRRRLLRRGSRRGQAALRRARRLQPACGDALPGR